MTQYKTLKDCSGADICYHISFKKQVRYWGTKLVLRQVDESVLNDALISDSVTTEIQLL